MRKIVLNRQLLGLEDFLFGEGTETQIRGGQEVVITKINAANLPFNETQTLAEWFETTNFSILIEAVPELQVLYTNLQSLLDLGDVSGLNFSDLNNKPTTLNGFGITDVYTKNEVDLITGDINSALDSINGEVI